MRSLRFQQRPKKGSSQPNTILPPWKMTCFVRASTCQKREVGLELTVIPPAIYPSLPAITLTFHCLSPVSHYIQQYMLTTLKPALREVSARRGLLRY
jgi:hypothetical protein